MNYRYVFYSVFGQGLHRNVALFQRRDNQSVAGFRDVDNFPVVKRFDYPVDLFPFRND
jgi:hypothetical protein